MNKRIKKNIKRMKKRKYIKSKHLVTVAFINEYSDFIMIMLNKPKKFYWLFGIVPSFAFFLMLGICTTAFTLLVDDLFLIYNILLFITSIFSSGTDPQGTRLQ